MVVAGLLVPLGVGCGSGGDEVGGPVGPADGGCRPGDEVVVSVDDATGDMRWWRARADGDVEELTLDWPDGGYGVASRPDFSPDGERMVVVRADGDYESAGPTATWLWTVAADGTGPRPVTEGDVLDDDPDWSPDGTTIVFTRSLGHDPGQGDRLFVVDAGGGEPRPLLPDTPGDGATDTTQAVTYDRSPVWSPDGRRVAFLRAQQVPGSDVATTSVMLVDADGTGVLELTGADDHARSLDWSPDGRWLAVGIPLSGRDAMVELVDADTGEVGARIDDAAEAVWADDERLWYLRVAADGRRFPLQQARLEGDEVAPVGDPIDVGAAFLYSTLGLAARPCG